jgi:bifunctional NMN adenylyltransferase/nudix hydrolase
MSNSNTRNVFHVDVGNQSPEQTAELVEKVKTKFKTAGADVSGAGGIGSLTMNRDREVTLVVYIGRFSPFHLGHANVVSRMIEKYDYALIIIGSSNQPRTTKNPFTFAERRKMILDWAIDKYGPEVEEKLFFKEGIDVPYNDNLWIKGIDQHVHDVVQAVKCRESAVQPCNDPWLSGIDVKSYLTGSDRDDSTYYLKYFPSLTKDLVVHDDRISKALSATMVREIYFGGFFNGKPIDDVMYELLLKSFLPTSTWDFLANFKKIETYGTLQAEFKFIEGYKKAWEAAPYAPIFVTVDSVIIQSGQILMVKRRGQPGRGLYALPGGFLEQNERLFTAALRETKEETRLKVSPAALKGSFVKKEIFDLPDRSLRGRTITVAYMFQLPETGELPEVKGSDDAEKAEWIPLSKIANMRDQLFEDHYDVIATLVGGGSL